MGLFMPFSVYILRSSANQLYIGHTSNLDNRTYLHLSKDPKAAKFTRDGDGFILVYQEDLLTRSTAMKREAQLKRWSRAKKEALVIGDIKRLKELSKKQK